MKSLSIAYAAKRAAKKKSRAAVEPVKQNFLSDEDMDSEMDSEPSKLFNNPHDSEGSSPSLEDIMRKVRKKHLGK
jgi:hypothetical protein